MNGSNRANAKWAFIVSDNKARMRAKVTQRAKEAMELMMTNAKIAYISQRLKSLHNTDSIIPPDWWGTGQSKRN